jgi:CubicO group peptidase (beta-lactamase class C family)
VLSSFSIHGQENTLSKSTPEAEGVSSEGILSFLKAVELGKNELHSFVFVRHGKIISEGWWQPYKKELRHTMFSVSKSFTSTAVGLAISENKFKLTDKVISFFPNSLPDTINQYMKEMTVRDLLMMSAGMDVDPIGKARSSSNWPKAFLESSVEHKPGTVFKYNNMATFMLSAIVQKATGQTTFDYLKPRLFEPLGIKNVTWDTTSEGYTFGAIGLRICSEDMAKFGQMLLQKGKWNGKQIVSQSWIEEATSFKINSNDPNNKNPKELNDWEQGYGYQFWICRHNTYRADGLGGQFIIVMPDKDAVVVLTCSATNTQEVLNLVWDNLLPAIKDKVLPNDKRLTTELNKKLAMLAVKTSSTASYNGTPPLAAKISGRKFEIKSNDLAIQQVAFDFDKTNARIDIVKSDIPYSYSASSTGWPLSETNLFSLSQPARLNQSTPIKVVANYSWLDANTLQLTTRFLEESIGKEVWTFHFQQNATDIELKITTDGRQPKVLESKVANE